MSMFDDPNREAVGLDPAWVEGTGGDPGTEVEPVAAGGGDDLDAMTKTDLLALAKERDISPANNDMTKQELIDAIRAAG
jgi:Rho termination factor, N-terminal domain